VNDRTIHAAKSIGRESLDLYQPNMGRRWSKASSGLEME
jgi:hypothetical protein